MSAFHTRRGRFIPQALGLHIAVAFDTHDCNANDADVRRYVAHILGADWTPQKSVATIAWLRDSGHLPTKAGRR